MQRKLEEQRKLAEAERGDLSRQLQEQRRTAGDERKELLTKLEEQRKAFDAERKDLARQLQTLGERLAEVEGSQYPAGQRVWVVMDRYVHLNAEDRRKDVLSHLRPADWEMRSETSFRGTEVYELIRRPGRGADSRRSVGKSPSLQ